MRILFLGKRDQDVLLVLRLNWLQLGRTLKWLYGDSTVGTASGIAGSVSMDRTSSSP